MNTNILDRIDRLLAVAKEVDVADLASDVAAAACEDGTKGPDSSRLADIFCQLLDIKDSVREVDRIRHELGAP